jgi:Skp family chaperone for outer membrane proteins
MTDRPPLDRYSPEGLLAEILEAVDRIEAGQTALFLHFDGKLDDMSDEFADLKAEVQEDIRDDAARDQVIADLRAANENLATVAQEAVDAKNVSEQEKADLQQRLDTAKQEVADAVAALRSSDFPNAPADGGGGQPST